MLTLKDSLTSNWSEWQQEKIPGLFGYGHCLEESSQQTGGRIKLRSTHRAAWEAKIARESRGEPMSIMMRLYLIHLRESDKERQSYLDSISQARDDDERTLAERALDDHDARIRGVRALLEACG
jgi:hypothetical protein